MYNFLAINNPNTSVQSLKNPNTQKKNFGRTIDKIKN